MRAAAIRRLSWRAPAQAVAALADRAFPVALVSDGGPSGRWSYLACEPDRVERLLPGDGADAVARLRELLGPREPAVEDGPPFQGGVVGLAAYEAAARFEPLELPRDPDWPDLHLARYPALLAFDHHRLELLALGRGPNAAEAERQAERAAGWLEAAAEPPAVQGALADRFDAEAPAAAYEAAVADVIARIGAGEIFQANVARAWGGRLRAGARPFDLFARLLRDSPAPFAAWLGLPGHALVSNSPERFVAARAEDGGFTVETRPIKGTRRRGADAAEDAAAIDELLASEKDRAENLMIVDLMRNDVARVCTPGSVTAPELFRVESYANVHHLVSTVSGRLAEGRDAADLLAATFPPGSITGAPKVQAMRVIAAHEPPRGPWCGSLFWAGVDGAFDSSVLIRTAAFVEATEGWRFRTCAGAGIVADSDPVAERRETDAKISALRRALTEG